jgi:hypothetical protein
MNVVVRDRMVAAEIAADTVPSRRLDDFAGLWAAVGGRSLPARCGGLLLSEWTKIRSVRSSVWTLMLFVAGMVGLSALGAHVAAHPGPNPPPGSHTDPLSFILGAALAQGPLGLGLAAGPFAICVLGVLMITSEYSSGMIQASLIVVPHRIPILAAKCAVLVALVFVISEIVVFSAFFIGSAIVAGDQSPPPDCHRIVIGKGRRTRITAGRDLAYALRRGPEMPRNRHQQPTVSTHFRRPHRPPGLDLQIMVLSTDAAGETIAGLLGRTRR